MIQLTWEIQIPLLIYVPPPGKHVSLVICVPPPGKHVSLVTCAPPPGKLYRKKTYLLENFSQEKAPENSRWPFLGSKSVKNG